MTLWKQVALTVHLVAQNLVKRDAEMPSSSSSISIFDLIWPSKFSRFGENLMTSFTISFALFTVSDNIQFAVTRISMKAAKQ